MWERYGVLNGQELWNNERLVHNVMGPPCIQDGQQDYIPSSISMPLICNVPSSGAYTTPEGDPAPWHDDRYPASDEFAGIYVVTNPGFDTDSNRNLTVGQFSTIASERTLMPKSVVVTAWLHGSTARGLEYGFQWLKSRLRQESNGIHQLSMYSSPVNDGSFDSDIIRDYLKTMYKVTCSSDPTVLDRSGPSPEAGITNIMVQWTFAFKNQRIYSQIDPEKDIQLDDENWLTSVQNLSFDCADCGTKINDEYTVEVKRKKKAYGVNLFSDHRWAPDGDWDLSDHFDAPLNSYLFIANVDKKANPLNIYLSYDGTFRVYLEQLPLDDLRSIDLCDFDIQVVQYSPASTATNYAAYNFQDIDHDETAEFPIALTVTSQYGGTWVPKDYSWTFDANAPFPLAGVKVVLDNGCDGDTGENIAYLTANSDGTWTPAYETAGRTFPPSGYSKLALLGQSPGDYIAVETVTPKELASGNPSSVFDTSDLYSTVTSTYDAPLEWYMQCAKVFFTPGVETGELYVDMYAGSYDMYNFRVDGYLMLNENDRSLCDPITPTEQAAWMCREPLFSYRVGRSIPARCWWKLDPRERKIVMVDSLGVEHDARGITSGKNGMSAYFNEFPENAYGLILLFSAEVRKDDLDNIVSPAPDATMSAALLRSNRVSV